MDNITDLRVIKTLENIKCGFSICIQQKTFSGITIKDITVAAQVNRSTFYKYYEDKYQLREWLVKSTLEDLSTNISFASFNIEPTKINESLKALQKQLEFMYDHKDWYLTLWNKNTELYVYGEMNDIFEKRAREYLCENNQIENTEQQLCQKQELFARLFASSAMTTVKWWYEYAPAMSPKDVASIIMDNIKSGMYHAFLLER